MSVGVKYDGQKPRWNLVPWAQLETVVQVLTFGAAKYPEADNWKRVPDTRARYFAAVQRHLVA